MRIVAGTARGRSLEAPVGRTTRPTSDRVREAIFSILGSLGGVGGDRVADLYAGSGALGLEALSRGASGAVFVERDRRAVEAIRSNVSRLDLDGPEVRVVHGDVGSHLDAVAGATVVFADPPYAFAGWSELTSGLVAGGFAGLAVLESGADIDLGAGWDVVRVRRYGDTVVTVARPHSARPPEPTRPGEVIDE